MKISMYSIIAALMSLGILIAASAGADDSKYPMTVTDSAGREVVLPSQVQRVIVLNTDAAEAVAALGASDMIVGLAEGIKDAYEFAGLKDRTSIGTWTEIDYEMIGSLAANGSQEKSTDLIVIGYVYPGKPNGVEAVSKNLEAVGDIPALGLDFYKAENMSREMTLLGSILGKEKQAEEILNWHDSRMAEVETAVAGLDHPRVYIEGSSKGLGEITTFGKQSGSGMLLEKAGGENVMDKDEAYPKVDWEWVVTENPDIIIRTDYLKSSDGLPGWSLSSGNDSTSLKEKRDEIMSRPGADNITAIKNNQVYIMSAPTLFGLDSVAGLERLANILHPEIGLDAEKVYGEYLGFMGLEEQEGRTFVYPEL